MSDETPPAFGLDPDAGPRLDPEATPALGDGLDPEAALTDRGGPARPPRTPPPVIDTRRYQWMIGALGVVLILIFSVLLYAHGSNGTPGVAPGQRLHHFVAPLALSDLGSIASNTNPRCDPARPARRGLNVCGRRPLVLAFFVTGYGPCVRQVDALQRVSGRFPGLQFAAVAVHGTRQSTAALVRRHHWTIPVAYDLTGVVGELYGVEVCPLLELARGNGIIAERLIGEHWIRPANLTGAIAKLVGRVGNARTNG